MLSLALIIVGAFFILMLWMIAHAWYAPEGYQDAHEFHAVSRPARRWRHVDIRHSHRIRRGPAFRRQLR
jgi:hypothetical protein